MPIHVAITRNVKPGAETEFHEGLREFFQASFSQEGILGASMITPPPGAETREYGILRTFASAKERDAFYASPIFKAWDARARTLTEGEAVYRDLHGLEAWFRSPSGPPPRWKMAAATLLGVYPTSLLLGETVSSWIHTWPLLLRSFCFAVLMVVLLTWIVMPLVIRALHRWLHADATPEL